MNDRTCTACKLAGVRSAANCRAKEVAILNFQAPFLTFISFLKEKKTITKDCMNSSHSLHRQIRYIDMYI